MAAWACPNSSEAGNNVIELLIPQRASMEVPQHDSQYGSDITSAARLPKQHTGFVLLCSVERTHRLTDCY